MYRLAGFALLVALASPLHSQMFSHGVPASVNSPTPDGQQHGIPASVVSPSPIPAGVHIPHACGYPVAGMVRSYRPKDYGPGEPLVPHGESVVGTAPA